jgi:hypothetical protein
MSRQCCRHRHVKNANDVVCDSKQDAFVISVHHGPILPNGDAMTVGGKSRATGARASSYTK